jgi:signal transduction histidine kinase
MLILVVWILYQKQIDILYHTQEIVELKQIFLSTMSHELRTPLGSILNLTQHLMVNSKIEDDEVESLKRIENSSEHLLGMINNLLQLSKLESNSMTLNIKPINITLIIQDMIDIIEPLIDEKNIILQKNFKDEEFIINTDIYIFKQIVMNLLSNAVKFTEKGMIIISLTKTDNIFKLLIIDTGIGIDKNKQESLFSEFYQAHSLEIKHSSGLGLALSQKMAILINSKIKIESDGIDKGVKALFVFSSITN